MPDPVPGHTEADLQFPLSPRIFFFFIDLNVFDRFMFTKTLRKLPRNILYMAPTPDLPFQRPNHLPQWLCHYSPGTEPGSLLPASILFLSSALQRAVKRCLAAAVQLGGFEKDEVRSILKNSIVVLTKLKTSATRISRDHTPWYLLK